jgi:hypothetical protein
MTAKRFMLKREFWLNLNNPAEEALAETIDALKEKRLFAETIRDGIRLICDLRRGELDVLFELFPWVRAEFLEYMQSLQPDKSAAEARLEQQLARLEKLLLQQTSTPAGPRPMALPRPTADEDDTALLTVTKAKVDGRQITQNFINSMMRLQQ